MRSPGGLDAVRLRPGTGATAWLESRVAEHQAGEPLQPVTVVMPSNQAGLALRRQMAQRSYANVRTTVLARLAEAAGAASLAAAGMRPLTTVTEEASIRAAARRAGGFGEVGEHRAVVDTLRALFRELRSLGTPESERAALAARSRLAQAALDAFTAWRALLKESSLYDATDLLEAATAEIGAGRCAAVAADWGPVIVHLPSRISSPERGFLAALAAQVPVEIGWPWLDDETADSESIAEALSFGIDWPSLPTSGTGAHPPTIAIITAPDAAEEVRAVVRSIAADLEAGVPLHHIAVAYRHEEPYAQLVRDTLRAAELPWSGLVGKPIAESFAGRGLLGLLHLEGDGFSRPAVLSWLSSLPHDGSHGPSVAQWDRLSRDAGIVRGAPQWQQRLAFKRAEDQRSLDQLQKEDDDATQGRRKHIAGEIAAAQWMEDVIRRVSAGTEPPPHSGWRELVAWAQRLREDFVPTSPDWPADQLEAGQLVDEVLSGLAAAGDLDTDVHVERFIEHLDDALRNRRRPEGRLGHGVVVGPVASTAGMTFEKVFVVGMTERAFPTPPPVDPIFPAGEDDPLRKRSRRLAGERRAFLGLLASTAGATLSAPEFDGEQRDAYAARWLLEVAARLNGSPLGAGELRGLATDRELRPWFTRFASAMAGMVSGPSALNLAEYRVLEAQRFEGGGLASSALALRADLPLGRHLEVVAARGSSRFTKFDGNLAEAVPFSTTLNVGLAGISISPTGIEIWAQCAFRYFMARTLGIQPTERPEDEEGWSISALDRGSLVHGIIEEFFSTLHAEGRPRAGERYDEADHASIAEIASRRFAELEARGQTGYRLAWLNEQDAIRTDLRTFLAKDAEFRLEHGLVPAHFEKGFGWAEGWPAAEVPLAGGGRVMMRGYVDRVDEGPGRVYVTDYKTGRAMQQRDFDGDPVIAGTKLQLAAYSSAIRARYLGEHREAPAITAAYWYTSTRGGFARVEVSDAVRAAERLTEVVTVINEGVRRGAFPQVPGEDQERPRRTTWQNCAYCDFNRVCPSGRDQLRERKRHEPGADLHDRLSVTR